MLWDTFFICIFATNKGCTENNNGLYSFTGRKGPSIKLLSGHGRVRSQVYEYWRCFFYVAGATQCYLRS